VTDGGALGKLSSLSHEGTVAQVGAISANGDQEIATSLPKQSRLWARMGVITIEESKTMHTGLETVDRVCSLTAAI